MSVMLTDSPSLVDVPDIEDLQTALVLDESSAYGSWTEVFEDPENAAKLDYLLKPGDYRGWGTLALVNRAGHTATRPKTVRYYNPGVDERLHPVQRSNAALVDAFWFEGPDTRNWLVQGLTLTSPTTNPHISGGARNVTVDGCLIEYGRIYSLRIRHASHCTIQRCVIREAINQAGNEGKGDSSGIQIGSINADVLAIKILDNEIYNVGDGIQLTPYKYNPTRKVEVVIEGNDIYLEESRYIEGTEMTWDENAIDIKAGSPRPKSTTVRKNRLWGFRRSAGDARGELLVVHQYCRNVVVEDNIMGDAPRGFADRNWPAKSPSPIPVNKPRNITVCNNQFYEIRDYERDLDEGAITRPITAGIKFIDNYFARSDYLADQTPPAYRIPGPYYKGNTLVEVDHIQRPESQNPPVPFLPALNTLATAPHGYEKYERKRWTGPELATGAIPATHAPDRRTHTPDLRPLQIE
jgi:hypothetical protein